VQATLIRSRFAAKCVIEPEPHSSVVVLGGSGGIPTADYGLPAVELLDSDLEPTVADEELELLRIKAGTPRWGHELDDRVLPAEAGLERRAIDFEKGCYPGQEPIARQHYRGRVNRALRLLAVDGDELPERDAELTYEGKTVGRITSSSRDPELGSVVALGYVRVEVPANAELMAGSRSARPLDFPSPRP
jgi:folate-binding protein YgfZ